MGEGEFDNYESVDSAEAGDSSDDALETDDGWETGDSSDDALETDDGWETGDSSDDSSETDDCLETGDSSGDVSEADDVLETGDSSDDASEADDGLETGDSFDSALETDSSLETGDSSDSVSETDDNWDEGSSSDDTPEVDDSLETESSFHDTPETNDATVVDNHPETDFFTEEVGQPETDVISEEFGHPEMDGILEDASQPETNTIPEGAGQWDTNAIPEGTGQSETNAIPEGTGQSETNAIPEGAGQQETNTIPEETGQQETNAIPEGADQQETYGVSEAAEKNQIGETGIERLFFPLDEDTIPHTSETGNWETCPGQHLAETTFQETRQEIVLRYGHWMTPEQKELFETAKSEDTVQVQLPKIFYEQEGIKPNNMGYFDPNTGMIYICDGEGTVIVYTTAHETVHKSSQSELRRDNETTVFKDGLNEWGSWEDRQFRDVMKAMNEGVTEFFTREIARGGGLDEIGEKSSYKQLRINAGIMANVFGHEIVEKAYFDDGMNELKEIIQKYDKKYENAWEMFCRNFVAGTGRSADAKKARTAWNAQIARIDRNLHADTARAEVRV